MGGVVFENFPGWVDRKNCPKTTPRPFRGRGEEFGFQLAVGSWQLAVGSWWRREVFFESRHRQCHPSLLLGARGSTDVFGDTFFSHAFDSVVGAARSIVTCTA